MKLRLQSTSVRLRLSEPEVRKLALNGRIEETAPFGGVDGDILVYEIVADDGVEELAAVFRNGRISVTAPRSSIEKWASSGDVALSSRHAANAEDTFRIVIEKDMGRRRPERA